MNDQEFAQRTAEVLAKEALEPIQWFYLSFAEKGFRGVCIVEARGILGAVRRCNVLGINPGGEVMAMTIAEERLAGIPEDARNILLSRERLGQIFGDLTTSGEMNKKSQLEELFEDQIDLVQTDIEYGLTLGARRDAQNMATTAFELHPELRD